MKRIATVLFLAIVVFPLMSSEAFSSMTTIVRIPSSGSIGLVQTKPLHVSSNRILNSEGTQVFLRGVAYTFMMDTPDGGWMGSDGWIHYDNTPTVRDNFLTADINQYLNGMVAWHVNFIHVYCTMQYWKQNTLDYRNNIKYFIEQCQVRGIYVSITWWRVSDQTVEVVYSLPYPPYAQGNAADTAIIGSAQDLVNFEADVANELKSYNNVIFEFWNEPGGSGAQATSWFNTSQQCINAIRATGATNLIDIEFDGPIAYDFTSGYTQNWDWINAYPLTDSAGNLIFDMHCYREGAYNVGGIYDNRAHTMQEVTKWLNVTNTLSTAQQKPLLVGEMGCNMWKVEEGSSQVEEYEWFNNTLTLFNQYGISYNIFAGPPWAYPGPASKWALVQNNIANYQPTVSGEILKAHLLPP